MERALAKHLFARIEADIDFLVVNQLLANAEAEQIKTKLALAQDKHAMTQTMNAIKLTSGTSEATAAPAPAAQQSTTPTGAALPPHRAPSAPAPQMQQCRALWDYPQTHPDDLAFTSGDIITIEKEENADWWRGSLNGRSGIFPSNHVERISSTLSSPPPSASTPSYAPSAPSQQPQYAYQQPQPYSSSFNNTNEKQPYVPVASPLYTTGAKPNRFHTYNPPTGLTSVQPGQTVAPDGTTIAAAPTKKGHPFAKRMGEAAAGGVGFGAGAAVGSGIINAIF
ncbi:hypothetical protein OIO90_003618 [Microbotryomycetes sp. JL221]|nr:hypothetical protein OIO90_003618 [Microbotryomycetes sp. JL221]